MNNMKKKFSIILGIIFMLALATGCGGGDKKEESKATFKAKSDISVVSREDGSGTRGAFIELFKVEESKDGKKTDKTTKGAVIAPKTDVMMTNVAGDEYAIGYVSLGSLNDKIKALKIDGVDATEENIKNKTYKIARPFNVATKANPTGLTKDFMDFIMSSEGQAVVAKSYIAINDKAPKYAGTKPAGKIVVAGSSSVTPIMEKLKEAYLKINTAAQIEIQMSDSTAGMNGVKDGTCDIGMASRNLKDSEKAALAPVEIAIDGIAVIVNPKNPLNGLKATEVKDIFVGTIKTWDAIGK